jgi:hypothetical protein
MSLLRFLAMGFTKSNADSVEVREFYRQAANNLSRDHLLVEYKTLSDRIGQISTTQWQTASLFLGVAISGLAFVGKEVLDPSSNVPSVAILVLASAVIVVISSWNNAANRWNSTLSVFYERLNELEQLLDMHGNLYLTELDEYVKNNRNPLSSVSTNQTKDMQDVELTFGRLAHRHVVYSIRDFRNKMVITISFGWVAVVLLASMVESCGTQASQRLDIEYMYRCLVHSAAVSPDFIWVTSLICIVFVWAVSQIQRSITISIVALISTAAYLLLLNRSILDATSVHITGSIMISGLALLVAAGKLMLMLREVL